MNPNRIIYIPFVWALISANLFINTSSFSQKNDVEVTNKNVDTREAGSHIWFLASDELKGRDTGSPEIDVAASYIASVYRKYGVKPIEGSYYQSFDLESTEPSELGVIEIDSNRYSVDDNLVYLRSATWSMKAPTVLVEYGMPEEIQNLSVGGSLIVAKTGKEGVTNVRDFSALSRQKREAAKEAGAVALIEIYQSSTFPWKTIRRFLNRSRLTISEDTRSDESADTFVHVWINDVDGALISYLKENELASAEMSFQKAVVEQVPSKNVVGVIEGSDPDLKDEYVLLSAHYDHIGVRSGTGGEDSIYNGARDNAIGVAAILAAAQSLSKTPAKRSVLLLACTGEEKGLLGSQWYADHPPVPLNKIVYNLNIDGAGYNDVAKATIIGLQRTTAESLLVASCGDMGLEAIDDPAPEQGLFDRSDNVRFAAKGIPAPTFSTGFTSFDAEIMKYYHQVTDEAGSMDFEYLANYFKAYALAVRRIANMDERPFWVEGDKYEQAGKELYGLK